MSSIEYSKSIPISYEYDVVVVGGGIAGVCAACAAADEGSKTILIERFGSLGGDGTIGGVSGFCGESMGQGHIFNEIIKDLEKFNAIAPHFYQKDVFMKGRHYNHEILALILQEISLKHNVKLLLHTRFVDVFLSKENKSMIDSIIIAGKSGIQAIKGKFFIDCTGEADLIHSYGGESMKGGSVKGRQLPMSINFFVKKASHFKSNHESPKHYFGWNAYEKRSDLPMTSFGPHGKGGKSVKVKVPNYDATSTEELTQAEIESHRTMMRVLDFYQSQKKRNWELDYFSPQIGIREGRRIVGEYILTVDDVRAGKSFEDAIAVGSFPLDAHDPSDDKRTYILPKSELRVPPYHIPLRSLIPKGMNNLLVAGRNLSADQLALSSARVMTTCGMMGEGTGVVAVYSLKNNKNPMEISMNKELIHDIQKTLENNDSILDLNWYK